MKNLHNPRATDLLANIRRGSYPEGRSALSVWYFLFAIISKYNMFKTLLRGGVVHYSR